MRIFYVGCVERTLLFVFQFLIDIQKCKLLSEEYEGCQVLHSFADIRCSGFCVCAWVDLIMQMESSKISRVIGEEIRLVFNMVTPLCFGLYGG